MLDTRDGASTPAPLPLLPLSLFFAALALAGCGGSAEPVAAPSNDATSGGAQLAPGPGQVVLRNEAAPPMLSESAIAADAADPDVIVQGDSPWVLVPSFRMGVRLPEGWYRTTSERILANLERTYGDRFQQMSPEDRHAFERQLRGAVDRYPEHAPVMGLIPSVRVLLVPLGGVPPTDFCEQVSLPFSREGYPDAQLTHTSWTEVLGHRSARCTSSVVAHTVSGDFPGTQDFLWIVGESHTVLIASMGNASDPVAATLDSVVASITRL